MTDPPITIRRARASDLDAVLRIERVCFADPWSLASFETALDVTRMLFLVAEANEGLGRVMRPDATRPVGYVIALLLIDEAEVADLAVLPESRGQGIGGQLLDQVIIEAGTLGVQSLYLDVRESNASARALYGSRSFTQVGRRLGYYQHPREDALLMRREIDVT